MLDCRWLVLTCVWLLSIDNALKPLLPPTQVSTVLTAFKNSPSFPYGEELSLDVLYLCTPTHHVTHLEVGSGGGTEILRLWAVVSLPALTIRMVHAVVSEVIVFKVKVVEVIAARLNLLALHHSDELSLSLFVSDFNADVGALFTARICGRAGPLIRVDIQDSHLILHIYEFYL